MSKVRVILDTNVLFAGLYSSRGASFKVLDHVEQGTLSIVLSTTLPFEYEEVLKRHQTLLRLTTSEIDGVLDELCSLGDCQRVHFLWRPQLCDPKDDHLLELAVASDQTPIVTHNTRHFSGAKPFGIRIMTPKRLLEELR
jgi:putative PIN family toxin of toxin-antitoxin system